MSNFLKNNIILTLLIALFGFCFFILSNSASAQNNDCQIDPSGTHFRPPGTLAPYAVINDYVESQTIAYLDIKTINCNTSNPWNVFKIELYTVHWRTTLDEMNSLDPSVLQKLQYTINPIYVAPNSGQSTPNLPGSVIVSNSPNFSIPLLPGERGPTSLSIHQCVADDPINDPEPNEGIFSNQAINNLLDGDTPDCMIYAKIYKATVSNNQAPQYSLIYEVGTYDNPTLLYECDGTCGEPWSVIGEFCFPPNSPQNTNNGLVEYGGICPLNNQTNNVTVLGGMGGPVPGAVDNTYSTEPLAPLPGFTGNPNLGQWLESLFTILIVIAGLLALIMIIVGGITYVTSESFGDKGKGKDYIKNAIAGLVLALGAWVILNTINPELAEDLNIKIPSVTLQGDTNIFTNTFTNGTTAFDIPSDLQSSLGLQCPGSGGSGAVPGIIDSFVGKTTYRYGGKGGHLPSGQNFSTNDGNSSSCVNDDGAQQQCGSFCPSGTICLDCSGFANHVRQCAGLQTYGGTSNMVGHSDARPVNMSTLDSAGQSLTVEGETYQLVPGDVLVWNGHVVIYYGNGQIAESHGSSSGMIKNSNIRKSSLAQSSYKNRITHIIKVNP